MPQNICWKVPQGVGELAKTSRNNLKVAGCKNRTTGLIVHKGTLLQFGFLVTNVLK